MRPIRVVSLLLLTIGMCCLGTADSVRSKTTNNFRMVSRSTVRSPIQESCFSRTVLIDHLDEPMQLAVAPDGRVYFIDRYGSIRLYDPQRSQIRKINQMPVQSANGTGLLGIVLDPRFQENEFVYLYYTPVSGPLRQRLSRFTLHDSLDYTSEKVLLDIPWEVESNAHTGGAMTFDEQGNLFLSVGDNTAAFNEDGYASIDERPNRQIYDAQRTAANSRDLRGKILRIHPEPDGTYTIPTGNLFTSLSNNTGLTRPEIYIMGCRNPFRMSYDSDTKTLYWGDIGPDDGNDDEHGPRGYDEINQAKTAGNYGWPYFTANNKAYRAYNFATDQFGNYFESERPVNKSVNNTGLTKLPPARGALIWYPYAASANFPMLGSGGRAAMVGPVYHHNRSKVKKTAFPACFDKHLFIFDWMRNQINTVELDASGNYVAMEPFMPATNFKKPIDMKFSADGVLYLLEYGEGYWAKNADASLVRIEYGANEMPNAEHSEPFLAQMTRNQPTGKKLIDRNDCRSCHSLNRHTAAPSFIEIAERYHHKKEATNHLVEKVIRGGAGTWGKHMMSAHPQLDLKEAEEMVDFILSLNDTSE